MALHELMRTLTLPTQMVITDHEWDRFLYEGPNNLNVPEELLTREVYLAWVDESTLHVEID